MTASNASTGTQEPIGGGLIVYRAGGHELIGIASGMKSFPWPANALKSQALLNELR